VEEMVPRDPALIRHQATTTTKEKKEGPPRKSCPVTPSQRESHKGAQPLHSAHAASPGRRCGSRQRIRRRASPLQYAWRGAAAAALSVCCTTQSACRARDSSTSFTRLGGDAAAGVPDFGGPDHATGPSLGCSRHATPSSRMHSLELFDTLNSSLREPTVCAAPARRCFDQASWQLVRSTAPTPSITS
jgi:hypothetical protein